MAQKSIKILSGGTQYMPENYQDRTKNQQWIMSVVNVLNDEKAEYVMLANLYSTRRTREA